MERKMSVPKCMRTRQWIQAKQLNESPENLGNKVRILSYNILAPCHLERWDFSYTKCDKSFHELHYRHNILMQELKYLDADVLCLQEVGPSYFNEMLLPDLKECGYEGMFVKRKTDYFDEGCATFFRTLSLTLIDSQTHYISEYTEKLFSKLNLDEKLMNEVYDQYIDRVDLMLITRLKLKSTDDVITVANTHLTWDSAEKTDIRALQSRCFKQLLSDYAAKNPSACVFCGDYNSEPESVAHIVAQGQKCDGDLPSLLASAYEPKMLSTLREAWNQIPEDELPLSSSYNDVLGKEAFPTNMWADGYLTIDYVFYGTSSASKTLKLLSVLDVPPTSAYEKTMAPDQDFASDHISLVVDFCIK